jgi:hypothetical protein
MFLVIAGEDRVGGRQIGYRRIERCGHRTIGRL